jgi:hypothetical protein
MAVDGGGVIASMPFLRDALFGLLLAASLRVPAAPAQDANPPRADCREWQQCRQLANDAAARQDFETFHDLAWRAVQTGPKNDPGLMYLLARAQSLSGRPDDALVMLRRLAALGVPTDAAINDDFRRVRALDRWADFEPKLPAAATAPVPEPAVAKAKEVRSKPAATGEMIRFTIPPFSPAGLAYDAVSRRFIIGDRHARKLDVVDEFSQHVANLAGAQATGFGEIAALEIDPQEGTLWVVSADDRQTALHKLQLVSARSLATYAAGGSLGPARFADVAATSGSAVFALDSAGHRVFRLRSKAPSLEVAVTLPDNRPSSMAPAADGVLYVAHDGGVTRVNLSSRTTVPLKAGTGVDLAGIRRLRWYRGALIAIQQAGASGYRAIRIALDRAGRTATKIEVLDPALPTTDPTAATVAGGVLYYLATGQGAEMIVRRVVLR